MTVAYLCIVIAMIMPLVFAGLAKSDFKTFNNRSPRVYLEKLRGWRQRAQWAQLNSIEAFPPFAAGVIVAHLTGGPQDTVDSLAIAFLVCRCLFGLAYLKNWASARSVFWAFGFFATLALFFSSYFG